MILTIILSIIFSFLLCFIVAIFTLAIMDFTDIISANKQYKIQKLVELLFYRNILSAQKKRLLIHCKPKLLLIAL